MNIFFPLFFSFFISLILTPPTIFLTKKLGIVTDRRKKQHPAYTHKGLIPRAGGVPIFIAILLSSLLFLNLNKITNAILLASLLLVLIGLLDDMFNLSPYLRFVLNLIASTIVVSSGIGIPFISNPLGGIIRLDNWVVPIQFMGRHNLLVIPDILAILWLTWTTNMINWSKGVDGQLPGFVAITAFFLGLISQRFTAHDITVQNVMFLSFIISGAYLGFLPFNFFPQKIMPGYGGGALAGFLLGILSILSFGKLGTAILILAIPLIDALYTLIRRIKKRVSPFKADWGHFHHRLLEIGWGKRRVAVFYWIISLFLGMASLFLEKSEKLIAFLTIGLMLFIFLFLIDKIKETSLRQQTK